MSIFSVLTGPQLVAAVDDFLADVSCESNVGGETVEAIRTVAEACFFEKSISVHEFLQMAATSLKYYPDLARNLNAFLDGSGERLEIVVESVDNISTVDLLVVHGPDGGHIYPLSKAKPVPPISNTTILRALLEKDPVEPDFTNATASSTWAGAIAELLQHELTEQDTSFDVVYSMKCLQHLRRLAIQKAILPPSFFLHNVIRDGPHPVFGGGFADVYKGKLNGEVVCLKALRFFVERSEMARKLLNDCCREALVWRQLNHPNVLPFLGVNVELFAPSFCLVSPWMSNGNLMQFLQRNPDFDRRAAITDIASAMQYLHEYSPPIVHADIRGANVLVRDDLRCCLADFGLSSIAASFSFASSSGGGSKGSIRWLAPEFFVTSRGGNHSKATTRDIYAFGCTMLEVYTGQHPFSQHKIDPPVMHDVLAGRRPSRPSQLTDELWMLIESCWQQDPRRRLSARAIMQVLSKDAFNATFAGSSTESTTPQTPNFRRYLNLQKLLPVLPRALFEAKTVSPVTDGKRNSRPFLGFGRSKGREKQLPPTVFASRNAVFGVPLQDSLRVAAISNIPSVVFRTMEYLEAGDRIHTENIYRFYGSYAVTNRLKARFQAEGDVDLITSKEEWDPRSVADLLKTFLRELPDSILTRQLHQEFSALIRVVNPEARISELSRLVTALPSANYILLRAIVTHLALIVENSATNKMTMQRIGIVLGPILGTNPGVLSLLIDERNRVFDQENPGVLSSICTQDRYAASEAHYNLEDERPLRYPGWVSNVVQPLEEFIDETVDPHDYYLDLEEIAEGESGSFFVAKMAQDKPLENLKLAPLIKAQDTRNRVNGVQTLVAIRVVPLVPSGSPEINEVHHELTLLKGLMHVNLLTMDALYVDLSDDSLWIRMELVEWSLADIIQFNGEHFMLQESVMSQFAFDVLSALKYLQSHDIVHRDVRADNLLLNRAGVLKLTDFKNAIKVYRIAPFRNEIVGNVDRQPPEMRRGVYDALKVDTWSVGATVWLMARAKPPFPSLEEMSNRWIEIEQYSESLGIFLNMCSQPESSRPDPQTLLELSSFVKDIEHCRTDILQILSQCTDIEEKMSRPPSESSRPPLTPSDSTYVMPESMDKFQDIQKLDDEPFTVFIQPASGPSISMMVSNSTTVSEMYDFLASRRRYPRDSSSVASLHMRGVRSAALSGVETMRDLGAGPLTHFDVRCRFPSFLPPEMMRYMDTLVSPGPQ